MAQPTVARELGHKPEGPNGQRVYVYGLALGHAFNLTNGEWKLVPVIQADLRSTEYTYRIIWVQGRACAVFSVLGVDKWAQPINGNVAPGVAKKEKAAARAERLPTVTVHSREPAPAPLPPAAAKAHARANAALEAVPEVPAGPSKAALALARMKARREAKP